MKILLASHNMEKFDEIKQMFNKTNIDLQNLNNIHIRFYQQDILNKIYYLKLFFISITKKLLQAPGISLKAI